jgi:hypothetical protein
MRRFLHENSLSIVMLGFFFVFLVGQSIAGFLSNKEELQQHHQPVVSYGEYLTSGAFLESVFENWESEFLQMGVYVLFTAFLFQKGSSESKPLEGDEELDANPRNLPVKPDMPWPVRKGGLWLTFYEYSLTIALLLLFVISFLAHVISGAENNCQEQQMHAQSCVHGLAYIFKAQFWFESFQNWQSEFFSIGVMVLLSIFLRQRGSPESKPVVASHSQTGDR